MQRPRKAAMAKGFKPATRNFKGRVRAPQGRQRRPPEFYEKAKARPGGHGQRLKVGIEKFPKVSKAGSEPEGEGQGQAKRPRRKAKGQMGAAQGRARKPKDFAKGR